MYSVLAVKADLSEVLRCPSASADEYLHYNVHTIKPYINVGLILTFNVGTSFFLLLGKQRSNVTILWFRPTLGTHIKNNK